MKTDQIGIRIDGTMRRAYDKAAKRERRKLSDWVRVVLDDRVRGGLGELTVDESLALGLHRKLRDNDPVLNAALVSLAGQSEDRAVVRTAVLALEKVAVGGIPKTPAGRSRRRGG